MNMRAMILAAPLLLAFGPLLADDVSAAENPVTRCGWVQNPTPGNWWLTDAEGDWILATQGSDNGAEGMDLIGDISAHDYVMSNGNYGYACGCMKVIANRDTMQVERVLSFRQLPLSKCDRDPNLPKQE